MMEEKWWLADPTIWRRLMAETPTVPDDLEHALAAALNRFSAENHSNTPDFILAQFLLGCLAAWNAGVQERERWYGRDMHSPAVSGGTGPAPVDPRT